jgi:hypothetical protein
MAGSGTLIGVVGYSAILDCYPLGPRLMHALEAQVAGDPAIAIENFTWSPVHVVQRFETGEMARPERVVLVGQAALSQTPGSVRAFQWQGGTQSPAKLQERIYEAVTGVVDLENTLMIGEHFRVWPTECFTVEADLPASAFGSMVMADTQGWADDASLTAHFGFSPAKMLQDIASTALALAHDGAGASVALQPKSADTLVPVQSFLANRFVA